MIHAAIIYRIDLFSHLENVCEDVYYLWISYPQSMKVSVWVDFLGTLTDIQHDNRVMFSILQQLRPIELTEDKLVLGCENVGMTKFIQRRLPEIESRFSTYIKKTVRIEITVAPRKKSGGEEAPLIEYEPSIDDVLRRAGLALKFSFDNFAVSGSNQVAYAAAMAVSESPSRAYNPLFLYGGVGVGKTHLAQSVARRILESDKEKKIQFLAGEQFLNELIDSIREKSQGKFRRKYRGLDILVVDDIQFIAGKNTAQEEFFHTFNAVVSAGGQIILTSDRPPHEIKNLEDRLRSRFSGGLIVDVQPADFELRTAILLIKAHEKSIEIDTDVARIIAEQVDDSRALEGTLLSLYAQTIGKGEKIDLDTVERFFHAKTAREPIRRLNPTDVIKAVCTYYNVKQSHLKSSHRSDTIALPRQIAMYILRNELGLKHQEIAELLKRKDHTTIMHGVDKINRMVLKDPTFKEEVDRIVQSVRVSTR